MVDTPAARETIYALLKSHILAVTDVSADQVFRHQPIQINVPDRTTATIYRGDEKMDPTLSNVMVWHRFDILMYWRAAGDPGHLEANEIEMWNADRAIQAELRSDSTIGADVDDLKIEGSDTGYIEIGQLDGSSTWYRILTIPIKLLELNAEAIAV